MAKALGEGLTKTKMAKEKRARFTVVYVKFLQILAKRVKFRAC
jgi:hypothetical protein